MRRMQLAKFLFGSTLAFVFPLVLGGCEMSCNADGNTLEGTADDVNDAVEETADEVEDSVD